MALGRQSMLQQRGARAGDVVGEVDGERSAVVYG